MKTILTVILIFIAGQAFSQTMQENFENGKKSFYSDDFDGANKYFMEILNSLSDDYLTHYYKGMVYVIYFDNEKAMTELTTAIRKKKSFGPAYFGRAELLEKTGDTAGAIADYTAAIKHGERSSDAYFNRASLYQAAGQLEKAVKDFTKAIEINPSDDISYYNRGKIFMELGEKDDAISDFESAIAIDKAWEKELRELIKMLSN